MHCQGQAVFGRPVAPDRLDLQAVGRRMGGARLEAADVYAMFVRMGLDYGPAHRGITALHLGERELLAQLRLPAVAEAHRDDYVLHPSLMDSALQASIGIIADGTRVPAKPVVPFALASLRMASPCTRDMVAWVRAATVGQPDDGLTKVDIDLCDTQGNVCVQMRGCALRELR
jgi:acyl transferase domain-containing protein